MKPRYAVVFAALASIVGVSEARAQGVDLTARTVYHAYQIQLDPDAANNDAVRDLNRFYQTLEAHGWSLVPAQKIDAVLSMRYITDFGTGFRRDTPFGAGIPAVDGRDDLQLLYAYVEWRDVADLLDLRFGRQVRIDDLAWASFDGIDVTAHLWREGINEARVSLYAGVPVRIDVLFASEAFVADGIEQYDGTGFLHGLTFGGDSSLTLFDDLSASIAYRQTVVFRNDDIEPFATGDAAAARSDGTIGLQESRFGMSAGYNIRPISMNVYGHFTWDMLIGRLDQARAGASYHPLPGVTARAEWLRVRPLFTGDSIFNYFNIFAYDRARTELSMKLLDGLTVEAGYFLQVMGGGAKGPKSASDPGNEGALFGGSDSIHGPSAAVVYRHPRFTVGGSAEASTNFGGDYAYGGNYRLFQLFGDLRFMEGRFVTDVRLAATSYQNDWVEGIDTGVVDDVRTSLIGTIGARAQLLDFLSARLLVAKNVSTQVAGSYRVFSELAVRY